MPVNDDAVDAHKERSRAPGTTEAALGPAGATYESAPLCLRCDSQYRTTPAAIGEPPAPCSKCGQSTRRVFVTRHWTKGT